MKITVTGRHLKLTDVLRDYAIEKAEHVTRHFQNIQRMEMIFNPERDKGYSAELIVHAPRGSVLVVHATAATATAAVDTAIEKMERHISRLKDKLSRKSTSKDPARKPVRTTADDASGEDSGEIWW